MQSMLFENNEPPSLPVFERLGLVVLGTKKSWCIVSEDRKYRYVLGRMWEDYFTKEPDLQCVSPLLAFGCLNPSVANHDVPDPSTTKMTELSKRAGAGGFILVNAAACVETYPEELVRRWRSGEDVEGPHNLTAIQWAMSRPAGLGLNIAAFGGVSGNLRRLALRGIMHMKTHGSPMQCYGTTKSGAPRHPLMLAYNTPKTVWDGGF